MLGNYQAMSIQRRINIFMKWERGVKRDIEQYFIVRIKIPLMCCIGYCEK